MILTLPEVEKLLNKYGIPVVEEALVRNRQNAVTIADQIGLPVVMKAQGFVHKTEHGAVKTNIGTLEAVKENFDKLTTVQNAKRLRKTEGILIQKQVEGIEMIIGVAENAQFGKVISFGLGGVFVELFKDISFRALPITAFDAAEMIKGLKYGKILDGYRKIKPANMEKLGKIILAVAALAEKENVKEMDINPLFVNGDVVLAADARILLGD
ncbi:MAG: acetate--CoA ligase family protein [Candidatus Aenigmarchaeota archaeon]|nr:acetate--CoA ligase family protein [Candidatus Aenigmarchaeota archaeon]